MYLLNPTQDQLQSWYKCNSKVSDYLVKHGLPLITIKDGFYYFVKSESFKEIYKNMPLFMKWSNKI
jgi:hypothetical protein